eukprot:m51a1_g8719 hypothetical protein (300) ;mRNA; r:170867-171977
MNRPVLLAVLLTLTTATVVCIPFLREHAPEPGPLPHTTLAAATYGCDEAYVVLVLSDLYVRMALGLQAALRAVGSTRPVIALAGPGIGREAEGALELGGMAVRRIPQSPHHPNYRPRFPKWDNLLSKLEVFRVPVERVVFMDVDVVLRGNPDDLFNSTGPIEKPGTVNSGVMFIRYNSSTFEALEDTLAHNVVRKGDQELIGKYWKQVLGKVTTLPDSYSTFHTRFSDWKPCRRVDQSFRWERPFMGQIKQQNDAAGLHMLELATRDGLDPGVAQYIRVMYGQQWQTSGAKFIVRQDGN